MTPTKSATETVTKNALLDAVAFDEALLRQPTAQRVQIIDSSRGFRRAETDESDDRRRLTEDETAG